MTRHIHADLIHAWADGALIQEREELTGVWHPCLFHLWKPDKTYRIKPEPQRFPASTLSDESLDRLFDQCESGFILSLRAVADAAVKEYLLTQQESTDGMAQYCKQEPQKAVPLPNLGGTGPRPGLVPETRKWAIEQSVYNPLTELLTWEKFPLTPDFPSKEEAHTMIRILHNHGHGKHCHLRTVEV